MACGCGGRAVRLLTRIGYQQDGDVLRNGAATVNIEDLKQHPTRLTLRALWQFVWHPQGEVTDGTA